MSHRASVLPSHAPRQSLYPGASLGSGAGVPSSSSAQARLVAKQAELEGLKALCDHSSRLVKEMERLGDKVDALVEGGDAVASVLSQWQGVFRAIQIARASTSSIKPPLKYHATDADDLEDFETTSDADSNEDNDEEDQLVPTAKKVMLEPLVRLPLHLDGAQDPEVEGAEAATSLSDAKA